ncbi:UNKNOWN [Stylonychia lemnae]|uniref:Uncharacterized protein n=1 Tax=Stylonychia lemnae TaxID=5949 RepID=A0A078A5D3_STYLE|nr:UNKNOWN [Stylonychia lemnae]|eukprot:CDW77104.1 UNKNOWN [Stylonychia lemnae]
MESFSTNSSNDSQSEILNPEFIDTTVSTKAKTVFTYKPPQLVNQKSVKELIIHSHVFKNIIGYLKPYEKVKVRALNRRICYEHVSCFMNALNINQYQKIQIEQLEEFFQRRSHTNLRVIHVSFTRDNLEYASSVLAKTFELLGNQIEEVHLFSQKKAVLKAEQCELIAEQFATLDNLKLLFLEGNFQDNIFRGIINHRKKPFEQLKTMIQKGENIKKATAIEFYDLFPNLEIFETERRNLNVYPHFINSKIKLRSLKITLPVQQLVPHLIRYLHFAADSLEELEIAKLTNEPIFKELLTQQKYPFTKLRKLRMLNMEEIVLKDFLWNNDEILLSQFDFQSNNCTPYQEKSQQYYREYLRRIQTGFLEVFHHDIVGPYDYQERNIAEVSNVIRTNIRTLRVLKFYNHFINPNDADMIQTWMEAIDSSISKIERIVILNGFSPLQKIYPSLDLIAEIAKNQGSQIIIEFSFDPGQEILDRYKQKPLTLRKCQIPLEGKGFVV